MGTLQRTFDYASVAIGRPFLLLDRGSTQILPYRCSVHPHLFNAPLIMQRSVRCFWRKKRKQTVDVKLRRDRTILTPSLGRDGIQCEVVHSGSMKFPWPVPPLERASRQANMLPSFLSTPPLP